MNTKYGETLETLAGQRADAYQNWLNSEAALVQADMAVREARAALKQAEKARQEAAQRRDVAFDKWDAVSEEHEALKEAAATAEAIHADAWQEAEYLATLNSMACNAAFAGGPTYEGLPAWSPALADEAAAALEFANRLSRPTL